MNHRHTIHKSKLFRLCTLLLLLSLLCSCSDVSTGILSDPSDLPTPDAPAEDLPTNAEPTTPKKRVAITFDDGPQYANEGQNTQAIVDELNKYGFHATFFVVGNRIGNGKALSYAVQYGNEIGIHGYTHSTNRYYDKCTDEEYEDEINSTHNAILDVLPDYRIRLMRPVGGRITQARIDSSPYAVILWDVDSNDYNYKYNRNDTDEDCERKVAAIVENVKIGRAHV